MNQHDFESRVLHLWMTTRVPLTRANLLFFTKAPRKKLDAWLDAMVREHVLDVDSDDDGEMVWLVRGAARPSRGAERVEDVIKLEQLSDEVSLTKRRAPSAAALAGRVVSRNFVEQAVARSGGEKSLVASGVLSLFGPLGWLYAGPTREVIPAAIAYYVLLPILWWLPLLGPLLHAMLLPLLLPASVIIGVLYAWQYNQRGRVTPLLGDDDQHKLPGRRP